MVSRVERASASYMEWVVSTTVASLSSNTTREIALHINLLAAGSIPEEGSSSSSIGGSPNIAQANDSFLLLPPERFYERD